MSFPVVAIIGEPNTGKSTLFNRLVGKKHAITMHEAGTTRDRVYGKVESKTMEFMLIDTGGLQVNEKLTSIEADTQKQAEIAINEADIIIFTLSSKDPISSNSYAIAEILRKKQNEKLHTILCLTKCDTCNKNITNECPDVYSLGFSDIHALSAFHNWNVDTLTTLINKTLSSAGFIKTEKEDAQNTKVTILGKPNVGKSSIINALLDEIKLIVSDTPGTTRDSIDIDIRFREKTYTFIDTAGIRKRGKIEKGIEKFSVMRSILSCYQSDLALLVIDGAGNVTRQDQHIVEIVQEQKKGLILVINKWDTQEKGEDALKKYIHHLRSKFPFIPWTPVVFVSAHTKKNLTKIFPLIDDIVKERSKRISTSIFNNFIEEITYKHPPSGTKKIKPRIKYASQVDVNPPRFLIHVNNKEALHFSYKRYLENQIREKFGFRGTMLDIEIRDKNLPSLRKN